MIYFSYHFFDLFRFFVIKNQLLLLEPTILPTSIDTSSNLTKKMSVIRSNECILSVCFSIDINSRVQGIGYRRVKVPRPQDGCRTLSSVFGSTAAFIFTLWQESKRKGRTRLKKSAVQLSTTHSDETFAALQLFGPKTGHVTLHRRRFNCVHTAGDIERRQSQPWRRAKWCRLPHRQHLKRTCSRQDGLHAQRKTGSYPTYSI